MFEFFVNTTKVTASGEQSLLDFLRDELHITSVKNGCNEGACGSCTVLVEGEAKKSCTVKTKNLACKSITTVEGLSVQEQSVYSYAFAKSGAVQCGFCIPGMVLAAKALLDKNSHPSNEEITKAIKNNICRCTGYKKIVKAISLAAQLLQKNDTPKIAYDDLPFGELPRLDAHDKTLGRAVYAEDLFFEDMLYGGAVRAAHPRAIVNKIDTSALLSIEGVVQIITAKDLPGAKKIGHIKKDWDVLIGEGEATRYVGDALVIIAAKTKAQLALAKAAVRVDYTVLPPICSPVEALKVGAPMLHEGGNILATEQLIQGDVEQAIKAAKYSVSNHYSTPINEHAFLEPETAVALSDGNTVTVYCGDQGVYQTRSEVAQALGLPQSAVRVIACCVGGGFGGKEDISVQHHAALLSYFTKKPVKFTLSRAESLIVHPKRHPTEIDVTTACDELGNITAVKVDIVADTGAYASLGGPVLQRACTHAAGPYKVQNISITGRAVYTNNPPAGAFRGFGVTQSNFAAEQNLNALSKLVGISPFEIRLRNVVKPKDRLPGGQLCGEDTAMLEALMALKPYYDSAKYKGIACGYKNSGLGVGILDIGRCFLIVKCGTIYISTSAACIGQGIFTVLAQIVTTVTGLPITLLAVQPPDTAHTPNSGNTTASRQTVFTGEAAKIAATKLKAALQSQKGSLQEKLLALDKQTFEGEFCFETDRLNSGKETPISHIAYGYAAQLAILNEQGALREIVVAQDVGRAINRQGVEGQIEGGVAMSIGYATTERYKLENAVPVVRFGTLGLPRSTDVPKTTSIIIEKKVGEISFGAKGIGELCSIPTPAAIAAAYECYDGVHRKKLPL